MKSKQIRLRIGGMKARTTEVRTRQARPLSIPRRLTQYPTVFPPAASKGMPRWKRRGKTGLDKYPTGVYCIDTPKGYHCKKGACYGTSGMLLP